MFLNLLSVFLVHNNRSFVYIYVTFFSFSWHDKYKKKKKFEFFTVLNIIQSGLCAYFLWYIKLIAEKKNGREIYANIYKLKTRDVKISNRQNNAHHVFHLPKILKKPSPPGKKGMQQLTSHVIICV